MVSEAEIQENHEKNDSPNHVFFCMRFLFDFGEVWGGFWERFGESWRLLGHFFASFLGACIRNALQWDGSGEDFGWVLGGFSESFGRVWRVQNCSFLGLRFFYFVFWLLVLLEGFGSKTICLKIA